MRETGVSVRSAAAVVLCLALALIIAFGAGALFSPKIKNDADAAFKAAIDQVADGNAGFEDVTDTYLTDAEQGTAMYLVKSGTGGKDVYCVFTSAKYRGCTVETLTAFSFDGVIASVKLLEVRGGVYNARELMEKSGILAAFGGVSYDSEPVTINKVENAGGCDGAVAVSVNKACAAMKKVLATEEEVSA